MPAPPWCGGLAAVTAPARRRSGRRPPIASPRSRHSIRLMSAAAIFAMVPAAATAEVGAAISLFNDYRFRGYTLSNGRPGAILDVGYEAPNGIYGAISGSLVASDGHGIQPLRLAINGG